MDILWSCQLVMIYYTTGITKLASGTCLPLFSASRPKEYIYKNEEYSFYCNVRNQPDCLTNLRYVYFERHALYGWEKVIQANNSSVVDYPTLEDGSSMAGRDLFRNFLDRYEILFTSIIEDTGDWRCVVEDTNSVEYISDTTESLEVHSILKSEAIDMNVPPFILLGTQFTYRCNSSRVYPRASVEWEVDGIKYSGDVHDTKDGIMWNIDNRLSYTLQEKRNIEVKCLISRDDLNKTADRAANQVDIYVPARIDGITLSHQEPNPSSNLTLKCVALGTGTIIEWRHNDTELDDTLYSESLANITGDYEFNEKHALQSTLVWKPPPASCYNIHTHDGTYKCLAVALKGEQVESDEEQIVLQYGPLMEDSTDKEIPVKCNEMAIMNCDVACARPADLKYIWTSEYDREGLEQDKSTISITVGQEDFNDTFYCTVENSISDSVKIFRFKEIDADTTSLEPITIWTTPQETTYLPSVVDKLDFGTGIGVGITIGITICGILFIAFIAFHRSYFLNKQRNTNHHIYENGGMTIDNSSDQTPYEQVNDTKTGNNGYGNMLEIIATDYEALHNKRNPQYEVTTYEDLNSNIR